MTCMDGLVFGATGTCWGEASWVGARVVCWQRACAGVVLLCRARRVVSWVWMVVGCSWFALVRRAVYGWVGPCVEPEMRRARSNAPSPLGWLGLVG